MPLLIDIRKLTVINRLIKEGSESVADSLSTLAGVDASVEIKSLSFVQPGDIPTEMGTGEIYSARVRLAEPPYGVFMMTFSTETAAEIAQLMTGMDVESEFTQLHESALQEMCNILTSGFIDGIANTLETTIDMGTPTIEQAQAMTVADDALSHVRRDSLTIVLDSLVDIADSDVAFSLRIFLVPDPGSFVHLIDQLDRDAETGEPTSVDSPDAKELDTSSEVQAFEDAFDGS
ncbi:MULTISPECIES: chemotaxis protein CheC [Haloarcula]|uniref:Chemotaxis protein n=1 Tax=Haloarcula pellucida TaxID=1427151 RepID=A0A830GJ05_9EURY|nr:MULTISPECIES: chemotaxis protein CheC [Halomicroarcula]MBX0347611.1 chemotaxis protein CheC [Halomicroarcula pellucida]MDS0276468.1 chemotaxis protein CheC [Halomicroarcula sp. S1AR25-4]GGN89566.1 chemotaxis protein [Halomicroarcula pellucida]